MEDEEKYVEQWKRSVSMKENGDLWKSLMNKKVYEHLKHCITTEIKSTRFGFFFRGSTVPPYILMTDNLTDLLEFFGSTKETKPGGR